MRASIRLLYTSGKAVTGKGRLPVPSTSSFAENIVSPSSSSAAVSNPKAKAPKTFVRASATPIVQPLQLIQPIQSIQSAPKPSSKSRLSPIPSSASKPIASSTPIVPEALKKRSIRLYRSYLRLAHRIDALPEEPKRICLASVHDYFQDVEEVADAFSALRSQWSPTPSQPIPQSSPSPSSTPTQNQDMENLQKELESLSADQAQLLQQLLQLEGDDGDGSKALEFLLSELQDMDGIHDLQNELGIGHIKPKEKSKQQIITATSSASVKPKAEEEVTEEDLIKMNAATQSQFELEEKEVDERMKETEFLQDARSLTRFVTRQFFYNPQFFASQSDVTMQEAVDIGSQQLLEMSELVESIRRLYSPDDDSGTADLQSDSESDEEDDSDDEAVDLRKRAPSKAEPITKKKIIK